MKLELKRKKRKPKSNEKFIEIAKAEQSSTGYIFFFHSFYLNANHFLEVNFSEQNYDEFLSLFFFCWTIVYLSNWRMSLMNFIPMKRTVHQWWAVKSFHFVLLFFLSLALFSWNYLKFRCLPAFIFIHVVQNYYSSIKCTEKKLISAKKKKNILFLENRNETKWNEVQKTLFGLFYLNGIKLCN